jgi:hypothetical protein
MEDESRLNFNANGSGVILRLTNGGVSFRSLEFQLYQALFKICDVQQLGHVPVDNSCLFDLLKGTKLEMGLLRRLISISTTQIYKKGLSSGVVERSSYEEFTDFADEVVHHQSNVTVPDVINFHQWLLLCKLTAAVQQQPQPYALDSPAAERALLNSILDPSYSEAGGGSQSTTTSTSSTASSSPDLGNSPISSTDGDKGVLISSVAGSTIAAHRNLTNQSRINPFNNTIAQFSLCSIHQLHAIREGRDGYGPDDVPVFTVDIIGWEYSDSVEEPYQQQHVKFKLQTRANKRVPLLIPNLTVSTTSSANNVSHLMGAMHKNLANLASALETNISGVENPHNSGLNDTARSARKTGARKGGQDLTSVRRLNHNTLVDYMNSDSEDDEEQKVIVSLPTPPSSAPKRSFMRKAQIKQFENDMTSPDSSKVVSAVNRSTSGSENDGASTAGSVEEDEFVTTVVWRRFSDFEKLVEVLHSSYPGLIIPPLPQKSQPWSFNQKLSDVVLHQRCRDLKMFLDAVCAHRLLRCSFELRTFLEASTKGYRAFKELFPRFIRGEVSSYL